MNRVTKALVLTTAMTAGIVAPATGAPSDRVTTVAYEKASGVHVVDYAWFEVATAEGLPEARPLRRERSVSIEIADESGRPVAGVVHQGDAELGQICGKTDAPLQLVSREPVHVHVFAGSGCAEVSAPTSGTVTFTFTR